MRWGQTCFNSSHMSLVESQWKVSSSFSAPPSLSAKEGLIIFYMSQVAKIPEIPTLRCANKDRCSFGGRKLERIWAACEIWLKVWRRMTYLWTGPGLQDDIISRSWSTTSWYNFLIHRWYRDIVFFFPNNCKLTGTEQKHFTNVKQKTKKIHIYFIFYIL